MEIDLSRLDFATAKKVDDIFRGDHELQVMKAIERQTKLAARNHRGERAVNGIGPRQYEMDAMIDTLWRQFYGNNYSEDPDLMKFLAKRNPEITVKAGGTKIQVGYAAGSQSRKPASGAQGGRLKEFLTTDKHGLTRI
jgi:hypothetical protein